MPSASAKNIRLNAIYGASRDIVSADGARLQQVVWNLLTNAIKFTPKGGQVHVLIQRVNSHLELSVSDTGIGIPESYLPHVFDRFSQKDSSISRSFGGLGLGLAICKQLVELHGGSIRAASGGEDKGATFFVHLPFRLFSWKMRVRHASIRQQRVSPQRSIHFQSSMACTCSQWTMSAIRANFCKQCSKLEGPR